MNGVIFKAQITRPVFRGCKHGGIIRNAENGSNNSVVLLSINLQRTVDLSHVQLVHSQDDGLQWVAA